MKIYIGHSKLLNYKNELYEPIRNSELNSQHKIILPHENFEEASEFESKDIIKDCDLMIADVSFPATGHGIEIGIASCFNRPIICIYRKGSKLSGSLKNVCDNFIEYNDKDDVVLKINEAIIKLLS